MNLKGVLDQANQYIGFKNNVRPTVTLATTFLNLSGEVNLYVQFLYGPQTIWNHTQRQISG